MTEPGKLAGEIKLFRHKESSFTKFEDTGSNGRVMSMKYLFWMEWARAAYFKTIGLEIKPDTFAKKYMHMVVHTETDFFKHLRFPEEYDILTRTVFIKNSSIKIDQVILNAIGEPVVKLSGIYVFLDYMKLEPMSIPDDLREMISKFEGSNLRM